MKPESSSPSREPQYLGPKEKQQPPYQKTKSLMVQSNKHKKVTNQPSYDAQSVTFDFAVSQQTKGDKNGMLKPVSKLDETDMTSYSGSRRQRTTSSWRNKHDRMMIYDLQQRFSFDEIKDQKIRELTSWAQADTKGQKKTLYLKQIMQRNDLILHVEEQSRLEKLVNYQDRWPLMRFRKILQKIRIYINMTAYKIIKHKVFDNICILIILVNSISLGMEDPEQVGTTASQTTMENTFLALYSIEMVLKILGLGFFFNKGAYLRDPWNILDFIIVMSAYLTIFQELSSYLANGGVSEVQTYDSPSTGGLSLNSLRAFRVLRPLRAITSIKGLQVLVVSVLSALPLLQDTILVLMSFFLVFSIACVQILSGKLKNRCVNIETGVTYEDPDGDDQYLCGGRNECPDGYFCGKQIASPDNNVTNFDNLMYALIVIFYSITLEGWSQVMIYYQQAYTDISVMIFLPMVFIGAFFLLNLLLAVVNSSFSVKNAELQHKLKVEKAKNRIRRKPVGDEDFIDESEPILEIGIKEYWITKRAAHQMIQFLRKAQARNAALALELKHQIAFEDEDPKPFVLQLPEEYVPEIEETKKDEQDSRSDYSGQLQKYLQELQTPNAGPTGNKKEPKEIASFAVNDFKTANQRQKREKQSKVIMTDHRLARIQDRKVNISIKELANVDIFQFDEGASKKSSGQHPFDLSYVHSQEADYPDFSDDEAFVIKPERHHVSNGEVSAIASDSSYADILNDKQISEGDDLEAEILKKQFTKKTKLNKTKTFETERSTSQGANTNTVIGLDEKVRKRNTKKKRGGKAKTNTTKVVATTDQHDKYKQFKTLMRNGESEFISMQEDKDPYLFINKKMQKIEINSGMPYRSTSADEVFEIRNQIADAIQIQESNNYIKAKMPECFVEPDLNIQEILQDYIKPCYDAYQLKTVYSIQLEDEVEFDNDDDDALILAIQPFDTVMSVGYGQYLTHKPVKFVARRSDIIVSSTLSITLTPADSDYRPLDIGLLTAEQLSSWCSKRHEFRGKQVVVSNLNFEEEHPEWFEDPEIKNTVVAQSAAKASIGVSENIKSVRSTEGKFNVQSVIPKPKMIPPTLLTKPLPPDKLNLLSDDEKRLYYIQKSKYDTYMRILEKRRVTNEEPAKRMFNLSQIDQLLQGKHHEDEIEDDEEAVQDDMNLKYLGRDETFKNQALRHFEEEAIKIFAPKRNVQRPKFEFVPQLIKHELDVPGDLEGNSINFNEVIKKDCAMKRKTPRWSGQDVLEIGLNNELSAWVVQKINAVRVWPKGVIGYVKKARVLLKMIVKHKLFDNAMLACVLLNTIVMGMQRYNMDAQTIAFSEQAQSVFTFIFIGEMTSKLLAIGPAKYVSDKMNWLDGSVVSLSIIELLMEAVGGGGGNLSAFKTVRVFRTFRVLRVARLLRALKSMQIIIAVVARSAGSFVYITLLMFVFVFIYTLLGMQLFGGQFDFPDGVPRGNYDSFIIAFLTVFQVLTTENWNTVLFDSMRNDNMSRFIPALYYVSWIFIGNYILLNLFLAILLDGFVTEDDEEIGDNDEILRLERENRRKKIEKEKQRRLKKLGALHISSLNSKIREEQKAVAEDHIDDIDDLDEVMVREIFLDEGLIKKKDPAREERLMYIGVEAENSLYLFHKKNKFRLFCYKINKHKVFNNFIMFLIGLSSIKLALNSYLPDTGSTIDNVSDGIDKFVNVCFLCEMLIKIIALGFMIDTGSYIRDTWNQLDGFIVITSMLDMCLSNVNIPIIKILRLLRTLRPLRVISHNIAMKLIVASLFESMGAILNVIIVITCVWMMFAIFAINIFAGKLFYCDIGKYTYHTKYECNVNGGSWVRFVQNFDDIFQAMLTLFDVAALEGWPDVMVSCLDVVDVDIGPTQEYSKINGFFFVIYILIGSFFLLNFFVGVLFMKYNQAAKNEQKGFTTEHLTWIAIQKMIIEQRCEHAIMNKPDAIAHPKRLYYWKIVTSLPFEIFILAVIVLNIIQMGISYETQSLLYTQLLNYSNYFFTAIFTIEMYLKMRAFSFRYFETAWNKFDCFIVSTSLLDILITLIPNTSGALSSFPQMIRILRVLRVTRIVRLAKKNKGLQALMATITLSVSALFNVFVLLVLVLFIFSVLAIFFFSEVNTGQNLSNYRNFNDFGQSFLSMFVFSTGENWNISMFDCMITPPTCEQGVNCGTSYAPVFWIIFVIFVQNIMLNLFILVIITQFETYYMSEDNPISKFKKSLDVFMVTWISFTQTRYRCLKLREKKLTDFFKQLPMPLGLPLDTSEDQMKKVMLKMGIRCDDGYVYFNELLYRCMRRQYGSFRLNRRMQIHEVTTQYQIYKITVKQQSISLKTELHEHYFKQMVGNGKSVNPFLLNMYFYISFNTWLNYTRKNQKKERHFLKQEKIRNKCVLANKPFKPEPFEEEQEPLQFVTIEVDEHVYYTSEEALSDDEQSTPESKPALTKKLTTRFGKNNKVANAGSANNLNKSAFSAHVSAKSIFSKK